MLDHMGEYEAAIRLEQSIAGVISEGRHVTADLKAADAPHTAAGTREMGAAIVEKINTL
jgi:isocitrate/isopropylmalate dehydrogenase